ncbi:MAG: tRNA (N(6)-L-threonylcarbamoyladenosine(37)-C(2))-methylthiotransferase MtaB [Candidatus Omnitrophica bacterium]|nr:tRNA (N(6)-L-threonylcarbamoyladenosine(37)-C(2))-methylthiotransferase MtaB [Candidatus Omnitrophota bacterium]MCF7876809.1 tRNA (N(6)-L-threonylcarbamoyladenosine(37)-C(2))-methylthiotransferase MtaB [Candidatus Omnitrophota bacterium]MCF7878104.1 tRNA (N(6)-L-threonylcarbamoyladenosine(37)-C(2))-methylthiotransferase MtaB [Candidatus Omnitrophota bacterium]MCF7892992.1 tRNA (N(6)-L-threonylcarbamoyladenosine(37)-C(2))-methylthiotransferase MtaB [Candidatus Omnitrophota bacterium]
MKVQVKTLGCKVNQYEGQAIKEQFTSLGHTITGKKADLYIINTCTVTKTADKKSRKNILQAKKENPKAKIAVCGCLAELNKGYIKKTGVDYIITQKNKQNLINIILGDSSPYPLSKTPWKFKINNYPHKRAFVKIEDGCDNFCSFCKIPYLRPKPTSRKKEEIIDEIKRLSLNHHEIVLSGVNLNLYGKDLKPKNSLSNLTEDILNLNCLGRLRISSLQPLLIDNKLISLISHPKMCPHLHLSFQYGQNSILKAMNKKETVELYLERVEAIKKTYPKTAISCDIIIGFPGETEKTFQATIDFLKKVKPMRIHIFTFSPREKTPFAANNLIDKNTIKKRYVILNKLAKKFSFDYARLFLNQELTMIAEEKKNRYITGYTQNYIKVNLKDKIKDGSLARVKITKIDKNNRVFAQLTT